jgi:hypothetical protein
MVERLVRKLRKKETGTMMMMMMMIQFSFSVLCVYISKFRFIAFSSDAKYHPADPVVGAALKSIRTFGDQDAYGALVY